VNDHTGGTTRDILALGEPHPAEHGHAPDEREDTTRRFGRRCFITGLSVITAAVFGAFALVIATEGPTLINPVAEMFGILTLITLIAAGVSLIVVGGVERLQRAQRASSRRTLGEARRANERLDVFVGTVSALPGRVEALTREVRCMQDALARVPDYGRGVIDGVQVRADALGPDADRR
jgi:hypothetical protein